MSGQINGLKSVFNMKLLIKVSKNCSLIDFSKDILKEKTIKKTKNQENIIKESIELLLFNIESLKVLSELISLDSCPSQYKNKKLLEMIQSSQDSKINIIKEDETKEDETKEDIELKQMNQLELEKRRKYLQMRQEQKEYNQMIQGLDGSYNSNYNNNINNNSGSVNVGGNESVGQMMASLSQQMGTILNMVVSSLAMFGVFYYIGMHITDRKSSTPLVMGLVGAISIMVIEMTLFIIRAYLQDEIERDMKKKKKNQKKQK